MWSLRFGDAQAQSGQAVAADSTGVLLAATFAGAVNVGTGALTSAGTTDVLVARLAP